MRRLCEDYRENVKTLCRELRTKESFDVLVKTVRLPDTELTLFFIDGFTKDTAIQKLIVQFTMSKKNALPVEEFLYANIPYIEADVSEDLDTMITAVLSGSALLLGNSFGSKAIIIDTRTYPARDTAEPEGDKVMSGARDGFVETLIFNTALIRRRIRNPALTMQYISIGSDSKTDVVMCYMAQTQEQLTYLIYRKLML